MRKTALFVAMTAMLVACGQPTSPTVVHFTTPSADASANPSASAGPATGSTPAASPSAAASSLTGSYGILIAGGHIELVKADASIARYAELPILAHVEKVYEEMTGHKLPASQKAASREARDLHAQAHGHHHDHS